MGQYNVFILALKEVLAVYTPLKMALILAVVVLVYRLPDIIIALNHWRSH